MNKSEKKEYNRQYHETHRDEIKERHRLYREANRERSREHDRQDYYAMGGQPMSENRSCSSFLGVHVAERVLSHLFKDVVRMPYGTPGYDFKCNHGYTVDGKAACAHISPSGTSDWLFHIRRNQKADYFLCIAFDDRYGLNPQHLWLIPGGVLSHQVTARISETTLDKWSEYEKPVSEAINCCNTIRSD